MIFEIGKCYQHSTGQQRKIIGEVDSTLYGKGLMAESYDGTFIPVGYTEDHAINWHEITEETWMKNFSQEESTLTEDKICSLDCVHYSENHACRVNPCQFVRKEETIKPPLGVMPKEIWKEKRIQEICRALYERSYYKIDDLMQIWVVELRELLEAQNER